MTRLLKMTTVLLTLLSLQACQYYGVRFTQGNLLSPAKVRKLHVGMSQTDVLSLLGTPVYDNSFTSRRWIYVTTKQVRRERTTHKVILTFRDGRISHIQR